MRYGGTEVFCRCRARQLFYRLLLLAAPTCRGMTSAMGSTSAIKRRWHRCWFIAAMVAVICLTYTAACAQEAADVYPKYYELAEKTDYSLIVLRGDQSASFLSRSTGKDGTKRFYFDEHATWGYFPSPSHGRRVMWLKMDTSRLDFLEEKNLLVRWEKDGPHGKYQKVQNKATVSTGTLTQP